MSKMTRCQHLIGLLIMLAAIPFALPLSALVLVFRWLSDGSEWLYDFVGTPFLWANRKWAIRCERVNAGRSALNGEEGNG